jgi:hypothetical protein
VYIYIYIYIYIHIYIYIYIYIYNYARALLDMDTEETEKGEMVGDGSTYQFREKSMAEITDVSFIIRGFIIRT